MKIFKLFWSGCKNPPDSGQAKSMAVTNISESGHPGAHCKDDIYQYESTFSVKMQTVYGYVQTNK
jgi:hypothetical protein